MHLHQTRAIVELRMETVALGFAVLFAVVANLVELIVELLDCYRLSVEQPEVIEFHAGLVAPSRLDLRRIESLAVAERLPQQ